MKITMLIIMIGLFCFGCATTYVPSSCSPIEDPPTLFGVQIQKICLTDSVTNKEVCSFMIPAEEMKKVKLNVEMLKEYNKRCKELNKTN